MTAREIPVKYLSKMGAYDIEIQAGVTIKTRVLDHADVIDTFISKFKSSLAGNLVVGVDVKYSQNKADLLILCAGSQCLIIQLGFTLLPHGLWCFLADKTICFVGVEMSQKVEKLSRKWINPSIYSKLDTLETGVELGYLAARVLKKPSLIKCTVLEELGKEVGIDYKVPTNIKSEACPDWGAYVFSHEEIKCAIQDAYTCHVLGKMILGML